MSKKQKEKHPVDFHSFVRNHNLCMKLAMLYLQDIADKAMLAQDKVDFSTALRKYQDTDPLISGFTGGTWIKWFLNDMVPEALEKENEHV